MTISSSSYARLSGRRSTNSSTRSILIGVHHSFAPRLRYQKVRAATVRRAQELDRRVAPRERGLDRLAHRESPCERRFWIACLDVLEARRYLHQEMRLVPGWCDPAGPLALRTKRVCDALALRVLERWRPVFALQSLVRALVPDRPLDVDAVRRQAGVQLVRHRTVEVAVVLACERSELREIEGRVARFEGIHRPADDLDALVEAVIALSFLQRLGETAAAVRLAHREHVRVMTEVIVVDADEPAHEAGRALVTFDVAE